VASPALTVQAAIGNNVTDSSYTWTTIHDDALAPSAKTCAREIDYNRGRRNVINQMETGSGSVLLKDVASDFDPNNIGGRFYPNVRPYIPIRCRATINGVTYDLFQHFIERLPRTFRVRNVYTERGLTTVDGFEWFAHAGLSGASYSAELTSTRVTNTLNSIAWPSGLRSIGAGTDTVAALAFSASDDTKALSHLLDVVDTETGLLFIDGAGRVVFVGRHDLLTLTPYVTSQATFCDADAGGGFPYVDSVPTYDLETTINEWSGTRSGGTTQTVADATSKARYGERAKQVTSLVADDATVLAQMQWKLGQFKEPLNRIDSITVMPGNNTAFWQAVLALEIGYRITVREKAPGFSTAISTDYTIQSISARFPPGPTKAARITFGLWPASLVQFWRAGVAGFSEAGTTTRAVY